MIYSKIVNKALTLSVIVLAVAQPPLVLAQDAMPAMNHDVHNTSMPAQRDPHAYSDGYNFQTVPKPHEADDMRVTYLLMDRLELSHTNDNTAAAYDVQAWYGRSVNRAILKAEGEIDNGVVESSQTELLWSHAVANFWNSQLGARYDNSENCTLSWLAFGIQGLAPYWFELDATGYFGEQGRTAVNFAAEYELLFTQKLILQPRVEIALHGKDDVSQGVGKGLSTLVAGMRLRYEIRREFAPYVGIEWVGNFMDTADYLRANGQNAHQGKIVAGLRVWF